MNKYTTLAFALTEDHEQSLLVLVYTNLLAYKSKSAMIAVQIFGTYKKICMSSLCLQIEIAMTFGQGKRQ